MSGTPLLLTACALGVVTAPFLVALAATALRRNRAWTPPARGEDTPRIPHPREDPDPPL